MRISTCRGTGPRNEPCQGYCNHINRPTLQLRRPACGGKSLMRQVSKFVLMKLL